MLHIYETVRLQSQESLDPGAVEKWLSGLPEKALHMGLRIVLALSLIHI